MLDAAEGGKRASAGQEVRRRESGPGTLGRSAASPACLLAISPSRRSLPFSVAVKVGQKRADQFAIDVQLVRQQKGVVPTVGLHVAIADRPIAGNQAHRRVSCDWNGGNSQSLLKLISSQRQLDWPRRRASFSRVSPRSNRSMAMVSVR